MYLNLQDESIIFFNTMNLSLDNKLLINEQSKPERDFIQYNLTSCCFLIPMLIVMARLNVEFCQC